MITSVVRQSIIIKCNLQESIMLGNYEFYYAIGLFSKIAKQSFSIEKSPKELKEEVLPIMEAYQTTDDREKYLIHLLSNYNPKEECNEQMLELYQMGNQEENMWIE